MENTLQQTSDRKHLMNMSQKGSSHIVDEEKAVGSTDVFDEEKIAAAGSTYIPNKKTAELPVY